MSSPNAFIANGTCYYAANEKVDDWLPCGNAALGDKSCCQRGDMCLSSHACYNPRFGITYRAGCSDPDYKDANCPDKGALSDHPWTGLVYCNGTSEQWVACEQSRKPKTLTSADACWCPQTSRTVAFTDSSILENVVQLPTALGGSVIWQPGHVPIPTQPNTTPTESSPAFTPTTTPSTSVPSPTETGKTAGTDYTSITSGAKVGIGVGVGAGCMVLLAVLIYLFFARRKLQKSDRAELENTKFGGGQGWGRTPMTPAGTTISELEPTNAYQWSTRTELDATPRGSTAEEPDGSGNKMHERPHSSPLGKSLSVSKSENFWESFEQPQLPATGTTEKHTDGVESSFPKQASVGVKKDTDPAPGKDKDAASKRIIICCDGTWQSSATGKKNIPSNVTRLARSISRTGRDEKGNLFQQVVYYSSGIGTGDLTLLEKAREGGFGVGLNGDVVDAYNFIVNNYSPGDKILCFGFSRGAYTARSVAGLVTDIGIIRPKDMQDFPDLFDVYRHSDESHNFRQSKEYREWVTGVRAKDGDPGKYVIDGENWIKVPHRKPREESRFIEAIGVFDTVGSLGIPNATMSQWSLSLLRRFAPILGIDDGGFHNLSLSPFTRNAFHALALDEHRKPFSPTLWHYPPKEQRDPPARKDKMTTDDLAAEFRSLQNKQSTSEEQLSDAWADYIGEAMYEAMKQPDPKLLQVWFPGYHINVGGGNPNILDGGQTDFEQISLISFAWMCEQVRPYLQLDDKADGLDQTKSSLADREVEQRKKLIEDSRAAKNYGSYRVMEPIWRALDVTGLYEASWKTLPEAADDEWALGPIEDSFSGLMRMAHSKYRTPGEYKKDDVGNDVGETNEQIHPSVHFRIAGHPTYLPPSLEGFLRSKRKTTGDASRTKRYEYEWRKGKVVIPEYTIDPSHNITRRLAEHFMGGKGFVEQLLAVHEDKLQYSPGHLQD